MTTKGNFASTTQAEAPCDTEASEVLPSDWDKVTVDHGVPESHPRRGRPVKADDQRKQQIALRLDADVLAWYRALGHGWQTRMNAVLKAYRDATR